MDDKKCVRSTFAYMPSGIREDFWTNSKCPSKKGNQGAFNERKCAGDIIYVQNPLFRNIALHSKDNTHNCKLVPINREQNNNSDNYFRGLFLNRNLQNSKIVNESKQKSRKEGMKERAETRRRDILSKDSSDEEYSSINSSSDLRSLGNSDKNSSNMDDAYNRRSRSARTERYFRRLSKEDSFRDYDSGATNCRISAPKRTQDIEFSLAKHEAQPFAHPARNNFGDQRPNSMFYNQGDGFSNNPIYSNLRTELPPFYSQHCRKKITENQAYSTNLDHNKIRHSDPGSNAILAYKSNKSPRTLDRVQYIEPQIFNYEQSNKTLQQNKSSIHPKKVVQRSYSFQSERPREYENRNNVSAIMRRAPLAHAFQSRNNNSKESVISPTSPVSDPSSEIMNFQRKKLYSPAETSKLNVWDKNLISTYDSALTNLSSDITEDKMPVKKRSSKDLGKELSELEKMYTSLRLSDDNLLERAEERCLEEFSLKGAQSQISENELSKYLSSSSSSESIVGDGLSGEKHSQQSSEAHVINDDMAYRKMQTKKMPALSETQNSLSQISYLLASSALILGENEYPNFVPKVPKEEPSITKDDMVYRNLHYVNNVLKVVEPQPPFGIPLRPATPSTNSNYLCSSPVALKSPPLKYVPQSEPNLITDDLAYRNLRKDAPKSSSIVSEEIGKEDNAFALNNELDKLVNDDKFFRKKKKAVRSLSANLYGLINEVKNLELNIK